MLIPGQHTAAARTTLTRDPEWAAPVLWRSELRNVLALYLASHDVLALAKSSGRSACDCEFVVTARHLNVKLVTSDRPLLASFPDDAVALTEFGLGMADRNE